MPLFRSNKRGLKFKSNSTIDLPKPTKNLIYFFFYLNRTRLYLKHAIQLKILTKHRHNFLCQQIFLVYKWWLDWWSSNHFNFYLPRYKLLGDDVKTCVGLGYVDQKTNTCNLHAYSKSKNVLLCAYNLYVSESVSVVPNSNRELWAPPGAIGSHHRPLHVAI